MSAILIVERNLRREMGHVPGQIRSIASFTRAPSIHVATSKHRTTLPESAYPTTNPERITAHFVLETGRKTRHSSDLESLVRTEVDTLKQFWQSAMLGAQSCVIFPTTGLYDLRVALALCTEVDIRIIARILSPSLLSRLSEEEISLLRKAVQSGRIHLSCEAQETTRDVWQIYQIDCPADFVLPCAVLPSATPQRRPSTKEFRVGILGAPRREKGSHRIPAIAQSLAQNDRAQKLGKPVKFVMQTKGVHRSLPLLTAKYKHGLKNLEFHHGAKSSAAFREQLFGLDCILLPYSPGFYGDRGSGMILDAVNAGIPIVRSAGMAMSAYVSYGNCIDAETDEDFATAILDMAQDPARFHVGAEQARQAMRERMEHLPFK